MKLTKAELIERIGELDEEGIYTSINLDNVTNAQLEDMVSGLESTDTDTDTDADDTDTDTDTDTDEVVAVSDGYVVAEKKSIVANKSRGSKILGPGTPVTAADCGDEERMNALIERGIIVKAG